MEMKSMTSVDRGSLDGSKPSTRSYVVAIAIDLSKRSKDTITWALQNLIPEEGSEHVRFKLLHVFPEITTVPSPMGIEFPISQVRNDVVSAYRKELEWRKTESLLPYKMLCIRREVQTEIVQVESDDCVSAIANLVEGFNVDKLVIGASSTGGVFSRGQSKSSRISECCPSSCTVYVVSNGKLSSVRPSFTDAVADTSRLRYYPTSNNQLSSLYASKDFSSRTQVNISDFDVEELRMELKHVQGMYAKAQIEVLDASRKLNELHQQRLEETEKLREISLKEDEAKALAEQEKAKYEDTKREASSTIESMEREVTRRKIAEERSVRDSKVKEKLEKSFMGPVNRYLEFTWDEIVLATSSFSDDLKVGMGSYGTVYKCNLRHATTAVKILHSEAADRNKHFQQELEILSRIRHPNLLTLIGACPARGCLVYEYMENGSLDERLIRKNNTPPIPWFDRYRIAYEVASALVFLHDSNPNPIIHRNLKPANILLDSNFVSKIGDVGLSTMLLRSGNTNETELFKQTSPVGTLCYIDPEYQRTGLVSPKSDVYAFGMVVLRLLTAKPAIGLAWKMEKAIERGDLKRVLDSEAGEWPVDETRELADLALRCTELRQADRPDLKTEILPELEKITTRAAIADKPGDHFICPILKDVMKDPWVAADGYSYDRAAIEKWMKENDDSPVTKLTMQSKSLIPNYTLLSAIMEWKSSSRKYY